MKLSGMNYKNKYMKITAIGLLLLFTVFNVQAKPDRNLVLIYVGGSSVIKVGDIERMLVGSGDTISTKLLTTGQMVITGEKEGTTNIHLWGKAGWEHEITVYVLASSISRTATEVGLLLANVEGLTVKDIAGRTVLSGNISERDKGLLEIVQGIYPDIINLTLVSNAFSEKMIYMEVQITEFNTNELENLGISWGTGSVPFLTGAYVKGYAANDAFRPATQADFTGDLSTIPFGDKGGFGYFGIATEILSRLNYLVTTGSAFALASPRLSARSGGEAEFLAGGQVPVVTSNVNGTSVEYKDFGISLKISPEADSFGNITAKVSVEVSSIDQANAVQGIPGFRTRSTSTEVNMKDGETLVISGLINTEVANSQDKVKWLGDIPILGALFRSEFFQAKKTELVIFVTPSIVDVNHEINKRDAALRDDLMNRFRDSFDAGIIE